MAGGCYFLGGFGRLFADQVDVASEGYDAIIPAMLSGLPDLLIAVVVILVLSASMSTLSSLVIASSSTLTIDLLKGNIVKKMNDFQAVFIMRCFIVVFVLISMVLAIVQYKILQLPRPVMGVSGGAGWLFPGPLPLWSVTGKKPPKRLAGPLSSLVRGL